jgi:hypothetical protein
LHIFVPEVFFFGICPEGVCPEGSVSVGLCVELDNSDVMGIYSTKASILGENA